MANPKRHYWWYVVGALILIVALAMSRVVYENLLVDRMGDMPEELHFFYKFFTSGCIIALSLGMCTAHIIRMVKKQKSALLYWKCMWYVALACVAVYLIVLIATVAFID